MQTFTYKTVADLEIQADVYRPKGDGIHPVAIWIHGGGLILGSRSWTNLRLRKFLIDAGYIMVSVDYRVAPETKLPEIVSDVEDACAWVHAEGPDLFGADTTRTAVMGSSAGGYLALMMGYRAKLKPAAVVSLWGYGDPLGEWFSQPSKHYRQQKLVSKTAAYKGIRETPITDGHLDEEHRRDFYLYVRQLGLWPEQVGGIDQKTELDRLEPFVPLRHVTADFPPTLLIHGTADDDVPCAQSKLMAKEFKKQGVEHALHKVEGAGHTLTGGDPKRVSEVYTEVVPFLDRYIKNV